MFSLCRNICFGRVAADFSSIFIDFGFWKSCSSCGFLLLFFFQLRTAAYCAILVRRSNFRHQASPRVTTWEHPVAEHGTVGEKCRVILPKFRFPRYIKGSFTCRKATTWDRRLYFPSEGRHAEDIFALKIRRLQPGANPRTWVPRYL